MFQSNSLIYEVSLWLPICVRLVLQLFSSHYSCVSHRQRLRKKGIIPKNCTPIIPRIGGSRRPRATRQGREVFIKFECYFCHEVRGENFDFAGVDYGPELSQMGSMHPLEYFTESIINPSAWASKEDRDPDGHSRMPVYNDRMTVQELIDLSAYLASLRPPGIAKFVTGVGKIIAVVPQNQEVVITHDEIKGVMDAMTMGYKVSSRSILKGIKSGDKIRFTLDTENQSVTKIVKLK